MDKKIDSWCIQITKDNGSKISSWARREVYKRLPKGTWNTYYTYGKIGEYAGIDKQGSLHTNATDSSIFDKIITIDSLLDKLEGTKFDRI